MAKSEYARLPATFAQAYHAALSDTIKGVKTFAGDSEQANTMASILIILLPGCSGRGCVEPKPNKGDGGIHDDEKLPGEEDTGETESEGEDGAEDPID